MTAALAACKKDPKPTQPPAKPKPVQRLAPPFDADTAYAYVGKQVAFGPRVPASAAHARCAKWLEQTLRRHGAAVTLQKATVDGYTLEGAPIKLPMLNIIGSFNPEAAQRVLLSAHWDTRPYADQEADKSKHRQPIPGANDGASGVAVLLEAARHFGQKAPNIGVDIILWDVEDHGSEVENSYCLGSQYWGKNPHVPGYRARYGINLDMVGGKGAIFRQDNVSRSYAQQICNKVWGTAAQLGYSAWFSMVPGNDILDDHYYVNTLANIPCIDIIDQPFVYGRSFFPEWHTLNDDMETISRETLKATGQTVMEVIYREK